MEWVGGYMEYESVPLDVRIWQGGGDILGLA